MSIIIQNLTYTYMKNSPFQQVAIDDINLKIDKGEFVGIIGHTGSGKSTLIQHFNGLLKPEQGKVIINGMDTLSKKLKELRKQVGIVFQYPEHQLFEETVEKDIGFGLVKQGISAEEIAKEVRQTIQAVGLSEDILSKSPFELSGGQKRRVAIAGVLVMRPSILILDEPTAGLDPKGREDIFSLIKGLHKQLNMTTVLVSHSMEDIARLTERIIVLNKGKIEMDGRPSSIFKDVDRLETIGLSAPQITYLMKRLQEIYPEINTEILTVGDACRELTKFL